jgi:hypothetical protein
LHHPNLAARLAERADVAQLVEHNLAKVGVAGSNPVVRSIDPIEGWSEGPDTGLNGQPSFLDRALEAPHNGDVAKWQGRGLQSLYPRFESGRRLQ